MNISLTPELEKLITDKLESGLYHSASEVVREGLRLLHQQDERRERQIAAIRAKIDRGLGQLDRGEGIPASEAVKSLRANRQRTPGRK